MSREEKEKRRRCEEEKNVCEKIEVKIFRKFGGKNSLFFNLEIKLESK
jgi:hypothetical protein